MKNSPSTLNIFYWRVSPNSGRYVLVLKVAQAAFAVACFWGFSDVPTSARVALKMAPSNLAKQTAGCNSPQDWLMNLAMEFSAWLPLGTISKVEWLSQLNTHSWASNSIMLASKLIHAYTSHYLYITKIELHEVVSYTICMYAIFRVDIQSNIAKCSSTHRF